MRKNPDNSSSSSSDAGVSLGQEGGHHGIEVYVVDHRRIYREGLATLLRAQDNGFSVVEVETVDEGSSQLAGISNDAVVLMTAERNASGHCARLDDEPQVKPEAPQTPILLVCGCETTSCMRDCIKKGAKGFITPDSSGKALAAALHMVQAGGTFIPMDTLPTLRPAAEDGPCDQTSPLAQLTEKEHRVLHLLCLGKSNQEIADKLDQSENTVKSHINRILKKLNVKNRTQAVLAALPHVPQDNSWHQTGGIQGS